MNYLTEDDLVNIYSSIKEKHSVDFAIPDKGKLESIIESPKFSYHGEEKYSTVYMKADFFDGRHYKIS